MDAFKIGATFCRKVLLQQRAYKSAFVVEELGLSHGKCRADVVALGTQFVGFEIKGNNDSLRRLKGQVRFYNSIFDKIFVVSGDKHTKNIKKCVPSWWGIIEVSNKEGEISFRTIRDAKINTQVDPVSIASLLWRTEVIEILKKRHVPPKTLREPRTALYKYLLNSLSKSQLKRYVIEFMKKRKAWRYPAPHTQYDGLSRTLSS